MAALPPNREPPSWLGLPTVAAVVLALALLKLFVAAHVGLAFDEGYYTLWSEHLAIGYLDHPPAVALMIALGRALLGNSELGVRVVAVVMGVVLSGLLYRTGTLLLDRRTAALAVLWYNLAPVAGLGFITTPDPPSVLFWTATLWAIAEFMASRRAGWWLVAGLMAGFGLWSKYTDAFLAPGLLLLLVSSRERRQWLKLWQVWASAGVALVVFAPVLWWNAGHGWASFRFQGKRTVADGIATNVAGNLGDLLAGQALYMVPILVGFALAGIWLFLRRPQADDRRGLALPVLTALPALAYFVFHTVHGQVEANWLMPLWPPLTLAAAWAVLRLGRARPALGGAAIVLQGVLGLALVGVVYVQALYQPFALGAADRTSETRGWSELEATLNALAAAHGARWIATSGSYATTGELTSYGLFAQTPLPVRQIDQRWRWTFLPPFDADAVGWPALLVEPGAQAQAPDGLFGKATPLGVISRRGGGGTLESWSVFLVSAPTPAFYAGLAP